MMAEVTTLKPDAQQVQSAEDMFSMPLSVSACYFLVLITTMTSFSVMHEKDASCPLAVRLQPHTSLHKMGFQTGKEIHSENQKLCIDVKPPSISPKYTQIGVLNYCNTCRDKPFAGTEFSCKSILCVALQAHISMAALALCSLLSK